MEYEKVSMNLNRFWCHTQKVFELTFKTLEYIMTLKLNEKCLEFKSSVALLSFLHGCVIDHYNFGRVKNMYWLNLKTL